MKLVKIDRTTLSVCECDCGYHIGLDNSFLLQVGDFITQCPSCKRLIDTATLEDVGDEIRERRFWESDVIQFARMLLEFEGMADGVHFEEVRKSMGLSDVDALIVLQRAKLLFDRAKNLMRKPNGNNK